MITECNHIAELEAGGDDCPNCPNQGWYYVGRHAEQEQCEWCWVNPNSKFTKAREAQEGGAE